MTIDDLAYTTFEDDPVETNYTMDDALSWLDQQEEDYHDQMLYM